MTVEITGVPEDRAVRVRRALEAALDALRLARREAVAAGPDPARLKWAAFGIVTALQAALVAALSGYETAALQDVVDTGQPDRIAPLTVLLRRARGDDCLNPPERPEVPGALQRAIARVIAVRNAAVHALGDDAPRAEPEDLLAAVQLVRHFLVAAPAFDPARFRLLAALIADELAGLRAALHGTPPG